MVMTMITNGDSYCNLHPDNKGVNHVILFLFYSYLFFINFTKIALHYHYPCPLFHWPRGEFLRIVITVMMTMIINGDTYCIQVTKE